MKKIFGFLSLLFIFVLIALFNNNIPNASASEYNVNVSTESELIEVLSDLNSESIISIVLIENIELNEKIELKGNVHIQAKELKELKLLSKAYIDLRNGVKATFTNINITKTNENNASQMFLFRNNSKQGFVYLYNCNLLIEGENDFVALNSISINGRYYLDNTNITGSRSCAKGSMYLSGTTTITNVDSDVLIYDFRGCEVIAAPNTDSFTTSDKVSLSISQKPVCWKGTPIDVQKFNVEIYYTLDGSNPVTSSTRIRYNNDNPISLIIDRQIKASVVGEGICYSIGVNEFNYDVNEDKTPGEIVSVTKSSGLETRCLTELNDEDFPEAVEVVLSDGRKIYALAKWDFSAVNIQVEGVYPVYATLITPYFVSNPNQLKGEIDVEVYYNEIEDFIFTANNPMQVGKNTNKKDYVVGEFSAKGGDETNYVYTLINNYDKFYIDGNQLKLNSQLPAGKYETEVSVQSATETATITLNLEVLDMSYEKKVVLNPYEGIDWDSVNFVSSALHNHTWFSNKEFEESEHNDVSFDSADERVAAYKALGFGAVVITEHDYVTLDYYGGNYSDSEIITLYGNEMSKKYHTLFYGLEPYYDKRGQGISVTNGIEGNIQNIAAMNGNGIVYFAHPNRSTTDEEYWYNLFNKYDVVYGMEVFNAGQAQKNYSENVWDYILTKSMPNRPIWGTASDDAHSNGAISTGWQIMLLPDEQMNTQGLYDCLKNGNSFLTTICINPETDDDIMINNVVGEIPYFTSVNVNEDKNVVTVTAENYIKLEWVSANGTVISTSPTLDLNTTYGVDKYVRCRIYGTGGMSHTQPIGIADGENLFAGEEVDDETQEISLKQIDQLVDNNQYNVEQMINTITPNNVNKTKVKKDVLGNVLVITLTVIALIGSIIVFKKKKE